MTLDFDTLRIVFPAIAVGAFIWPLGFYHGRQYERMRAQVAALQPPAPPSWWAGAEQFITKRVDVVVQNAERLIARLEERAARAPVEHPPPTPPLPEIPEKKGSGLAPAPQPAQPAASAESDLAALRNELEKLNPKPTT